MDDEPRESTYLINWHPWQPTALIFCGAALVISLLLGALISRMDTLLASNLSTQLSCIESKTHD